MADPYAANVVLHFPFNLDTSTWGYIYDCSQANNTIVQAGLQCNTEQFKYGDASGYCGGTYCSIANNSNFDLTGVDWTIETWVRPNGNYTNWNCIACKRGASAEWYVGLAQTTGRMSYYNGTIYSSTTTPTANVWSHLAWVRSGTNLSMYINGVSVYSNTITTAVNSGSNQVTIGTYSTDSYYGYLDDLRITKGVARYTGDFSGSLPTAIEYTPPSLSSEVVYNVTTTNGNLGPQAYSESPKAVFKGYTYLSYNYYFGGNGKIYGTVKQKSTPSNIPLKRRVVLYDRQTNIQLRETWSDPVTGNYSFEYLDTTKDFFVIAFDYTSTYKAVVADSVYPTVIS